MFLKPLRMTWLVDLQQRLAEAAAASKQRNSQLLQELGDTAQLDACCSAAANVQASDLCLPFKQLLEPDDCMCCGICCNCSSNGGQQLPCAYRLVAGQLNMQQHNSFTNVITKIELLLLSLLCSCVRCARRTRHW
jgi:hypothetical protein